MRSRGCRLVYCRACLPAVVPAALPLSGSRIPSMHLQVEMVADPPGQFAHIGGPLSVVIDVTAPAGERVVSLAYDCVEVADTDRFQVAVNNFIQAGGDDFTMLDVRRHLFSSQSHESMPASRRLHFDVHLVCCGSPAVLWFACCAGSPAVFRLGCDSPRKAEARALS